MSSPREPLEYDLFSLSRYRYEAVRSRAISVVDEYSSSPETDWLAREDGDSVTGVVSIFSLQLERRNTETEKRDTIKICDIENKIKI